MRCGFVEKYACSSTPSICIRKYPLSEVADEVFGAANPKLNCSRIYCEAAGGAAATLWGTMRRHSSASATISRTASAHTATHAGRVGALAIAVRTEAAELAGEVRFRRDGDRLCVETVTPVMWFARHVLDSSREPPDVGLSFDGVHVTLHAPNGQWIWKLTGRTRCCSRGPDAEPLVMVEGIWPD
jgi:hypothetical protein